MIEFEPNKKGKKYYFLNSSILPVAKKGWHLLLVNDTITLLKSFNKTVVEHKSYNSPIEYSIETTDDYHVVYKNQAYDIKKLADFVQVLPEKKAEIEANNKMHSMGMSK